MTSETEAKSHGEKLSGAAEKLQALARPVLDVIYFLIPLMIKHGRMVKTLYLKLPQNMINFFIGFIFCFFGGMYPVLFAAVEAADQGGRETVVAALTDIANEASVILEESKKDDEVDTDGNGKADVDDLAGKDFVSRKTMLVLRKMNPAKVDKAMNSIYKVWLSVAAVLSIEFARAIAMALAIADFLKMPVDRFIAPTIQVAVPDEYDKWVPIILGW
jgi:hypothetical protein